MTDNYRSLLATRDTRRFVLAGFVGRIPMAMLGLGTVLFLTARTGSYAVSGVVCATMLVAQALAAPRIGRLTDRIGQRRVLRPVLALHALGMFGMVAVAASRLPVWLVLAPAVLTGACFPPIGSLVRARWTDQVGGTPLLNTAFALEAGLDEVVYIIGPVLTAFAVAVVTPAAGLVLAAVLTLAGGLAFAAQRRTEPRPAPHRRAGPSAIRIVGVRVVVVCGLALGTVLGAVEVAMVAFAGQHHHTVLAGPLVAALSVGSLLAGLLYGARRWRLPLARRFQLASVGLLLGTLPIAAVDGIWPMAGAVLVGGLALAPTLIIGYELMESLVPAGATTEGFAWMQTALGTGLAVGSAAAGKLADLASGHRAFLVAVVAAAGVLVVAVAGGRCLVTGPATAGPPAAEPVAGSSPHRPSPGIGDTESSHVDATGATYREVDGRQIHPDPAGR